MKKAKIIKELEKHMKAVKKERDKLDEFISDLEDLREDCDNSYDLLISARDALSEIV
jgi:hypothetical protein